MFPLVIKLSVVTALAMMVCLVATTQGSAAERPNVLLISIDDLNDWVGCLEGHPQASTPNIDRLSQRGVLFSNAHCQAPICNPSRTSLMVGLRPSTTGVYLNSPWFRQTPKNARRVTLPQYFRSHGYDTLTAGKIYHGSRVDGPSFETVGPRPGQRLKIDQQIVKDIQSRSRLWDFGPQAFAEDQFGDAVTATWAVEEIAKRRDKPFFLAIGFYRPHVPFYAPRRFFEDRPLAAVKLPTVKPDDRSDLPEAAISLTSNATPPPHDWFVDSKQWRPAVQAWPPLVSRTRRWDGCSTHSTPAPTPTTPSSYSSPITAFTSARNSGGRSSPCGSGRRACR
jgi:arylsulfatase A-like enzyme